jgi:hypothetical protein
VIGALAWSFKAWLALLQPKAIHRQILLGMEFRHCSSNRENPEPVRGRVLSNFWC